jgi:ribosome modulation factor
MTTAHEEGFRSFLTGEDSDKNPYTSNPENKKTKWYTGWYDARRIQAHGKLKNDEEDERLYQLMEKIIYEMHKKA